MHPHRMSNFLSFRSLFETREQRIVRLANAGRFDKLIEMGVEPELLEWHALRHRDLGEAEALMEPAVQEAVAEPVQELEPARMAS